MELLKQGKKKQPKQKCQQTVQLLMLVDAVRTSHRKTNRLALIRIGCFVFCFALHRLHACWFACLIDYLSGMAMLLIIIKTYMSKCVDQSPCSLTCLHVLLVYLPLWPCTSIVHFEFNLSLHFSFIQYIYIQLNIYIYFSIYRLEHILFFAFINKHTHTFSQWVHYWTTWVAERKKKRERVRMHTF